MNEYLISPKSKTITLYGNWTIQEFLDLQMKLSMCNLIDGSWVIKSKKEDDTTTAGTVLRSDSRSDVKNNEEQEDRLFV